MDKTIDLANIETDYNKEGLIQITDEKFETENNLKFTGNEVNLITYCSNCKTPKNQREINMFDFNGKIIYDNFLGKNYHDNLYNQSSKINEDNLFNQTVFFF